ncbi:hypothetical protein EsHS_00002260 [Epichloe bromicola]
MAANNAQVLDAAETGPKSPECGYESPNEQTQPGFFSSPSPTPSMQRAQLSPSSVAEAPASSLLPTTSMAALRPRVSFGPHLSAPNQACIQDVVGKAEKLRPDGKVTLKDRIACCQWTFFTMVRMNEQMLPLRHRD